MRRLVAEGGRAAVADLNRQGLAMTQAGGGAIVNVASLNSRANTVSPGFTDTPLTAGDPDPRPFVEGIRAQRAAGTAPAGPGPRR